MITDKQITEAWHRFKTIEGVSRKLNRNERKKMNKAKFCIKCFHWVGWIRLSSTTWKCKRCGAINPSS